MRFPLSIKQLHNFTLGVSEKRAQPNRVWSTQVNIIQFNGFYTFKNHIGPITAPATGTGGASRKAL